VPVFKRNYIPTNLQPRAYERCAETRRFMSVVLYLIVVENIALHNTCTSFLGN